MHETRLMVGKPGELPDGITDIDMRVASVPMNAESIKTLIDVLRHDIIAPLYTWIDEAKSSPGRPIGADIPASFFQLLHCEQDANKLAFALENMRRHIVREEEDADIRSGRKDHRPDTL